MEDVQVLFKVENKLNVFFKGKYIHIMSRYLFSPNTNISFEESVQASATVHQIGLESALHPLLRSPLKICV